MMLISEAGTVIIGTLDKIPGVALINSEKCSRSPEGTFELSYSGQTDVNWNEQVTVTRNGKRVFVDENGDTWTEDQLKLVNGSRLD